MTYEMTGDWLKENCGACLAWLIVIIIISLLVITKPEATRYNHLFKQGDVVCMKITNEKAQVLDSSRNRESIEIRIAVTSSIASDGSTTTARKYSSIWVEDFEVEKCNTDK